MIRKKREIPIKLLKTEALLRRLPLEHPIRDELVKDQLRLQAGFKGERSLDYVLNFIPRDEFLILHDLRLYDRISHFQIDTLILHPCFFLLIEVKNFSGTLYFDPLFDQMIRTTSHGEEEAFPDPIRQVCRQRAQLITFLENRSWALPPIESVVVIPNAHTLLRTSPGNQACLKKVIRDTRLVDTIGNFTTQHRKKFLSMTELRKLASQLIRNHTPLDPDLLARYGVSPSDLMTGVCCPDCRQFSMEKRKFWHCSHCSYRSQDAHIAALQDYGLLIASEISNRQAKDFLHLPSSQSAYQLLKSIKVKPEGIKKGRKYDLTQLLKKMTKSSI